LSWYYNGLLIDQGNRPTNGVGADRAVNAAIEGFLFQAFHIIYPQPKRRADNRKVSKPFFVRLNGQALL
jgi:hypothetical protein